MDGGTGTVGEVGDRSSRGRLSMRGEFKYAWGGKEGGPGRM